MVDKTTVKIKKEPTQELLRNVKSELTIALQSDCTYDDAVLFLAANRILTENEILKFIKKYPGVSEGRVSGVEALRKLGEFVLNGMTEETRNELVEEIESDHSKEMEVAENLYEEGEFSEGGFKQAEKMLEKSKESYIKILDKLMDERNQVWKVRGKVSKTPRSG